MKDKGTGKGHLQVPGAQAEAKGPLTGAAGERCNLVPQDADQVVSHQATRDGRLCIPCPVHTLMN